MPLVDPATKTTITDTSSYDNIWLDPEDTQEFIALFEILAFDEEMFGNDDRRASLEVSDHRPVAAVFDTDRDDDNGGNYDLPVAVTLSESTAAPRGEALPTSGQVRITHVVKHQRTETFRGEAYPGGQQKDHSNL